MTSDAFKSALNRLQALCARKEYCRSEMFQKALKLLDGDRDAAEELVGVLVKERFVDDLRYASAFARDKALLDAWGPVKIRYQLSAKGIDRELISEALAGIDSDRAEKRLKDILSSKLRSLNGAVDARLRLLRFALSRGYEYDTVERILKEL